MAKRTEKAVYQYVGTGGYLAGLPADPAVLLTERDLARAGYSPAAVLGSGLYVVAPPATPPPPDAEVSAEAETAAILADPAAMDAIHADQADPTGGEFTPLADVLATLNLDPPAPAPADTVPAPTPDPAPDAPAPEEAP